MILKKYLDLNLRWNRKKKLNLLLHFILKYIKTFIILIQNQYGLSGHFGNESRENMQNSNFSSKITQFFIL